jgi:8-oxo-dGTP pyrophosphatase MutT (NUDIX family)
MVWPMPTVDEIRNSLAAHRPEIRSAKDARRAAVAVVLREVEGSAEVLFIERAHRSDDPWSGHMAFPGGRVDPGDRDDRSAAERETLEEVGVSLDSARYLGRLTDLEGRHSGRPAGLVISAHVYYLQEPRRLVLNSEVREAFWFPISELLDPDRHVDYAHPLAGRIPFPGILVGEPERHVVWGLTYRFLEVLLEIAGRPLPPRWPDLL